MPLRLTPHRDPKIDDRAKETHKELPELATYHFLDPWFAIVVAIALHADPGMSIPKGYIEVERIGEMDEQELNELKAILTKEVDLKITCMHHTCNGITYERRVLAIDVSIAMVCFHSEHEGHKTEVYKDGVKVYP